MIQEDDTIRLRVVGTRVDANDIVSAVVCAFNRVYTHVRLLSLTILQFAVGSIMDDYLGIIST